jgi:GNAT superfamily N-acetyltransferase
MNTSHNIDIKKIGITDVALLSDIAVHAYCDHYKHLWYDEGKWYVEKSFSKENLLSELKDENAGFFIIYFNNEAVGFLKLNIDAPFQENTDALELERIYLIKSVTGKGIGKHVFEFVMDIAKQCNKKLIWLKVMDSSADAIAFYKKMGFEIFDVTRLDFEKMKPELRGMYLLKRELRSVF